MERGEDSNEIENLVSHVGIFFGALTVRVLQCGRRIHIHTTRDF